VLVPGVAFDIRGGRIGFGKGYYDRFLQQLPPHTVLIGLSYDETVTDFVPRDYHDVGMDYVVTPSTTYDFKSRHPRR